MIRSPSQCPGTPRSSTSAGRLEIITSSLTCAHALARALARGMRNARPRRRQLSTLAGSLAGVGFGGADRHLVALLNLTQRGRGRASVSEVSATGPERGGQERRLGGDSPPFTSVIFARSAHCSFACQSRLHGACQRGGSWAEGVSKRAEGGALSDAKSTDVRAAHAVSFVAVLRTAVVAVPLRYWVASRPVDDRLMPFPAVASCPCRTVHRFPAWRRRRRSGGCQSTLARGRWNALVCAGRYIGCGCGSRARPRPWPNDRPPCGACAGRHDAWRRHLLAASPRDRDDAG